MTTSQAHQLVRLLKDQDPELRVDGARKAQAMARTEAGRAAMFSIQMESLLTAMLIPPSSRGDPALLEVLLQAISTMADQDSAQRMSFVDVGIVPKLIELLSHMRTSLPMYAAQVLRNLARDSSTQVEITKAGGLWPLVRLLHEGAAGAKDAAAAALSNLVIKEQNARLVCERGAIASLAKMVTEGIDSGKAAAAGTLSNLALFPDTAKLVFDEPGALKGLISLCNSSNSLVQTNAAGALANLSLYPDMAVRIYSLRGMAIILDLLRETSTPSVKDNCAAVLRSFSMHEKISPRLLEAGGVAALISLLKDDTANLVGREVAADAIKHLGYNHDYARIIVEAGGIEALLALQRQVSVNGETIVAAALAVLAQFPDIVERMESSGAVDVLIEQLCFGVIPARGYTAESLRHLTHVPDYANKMTEHGAIPILLELLSTGSDTGREASKQILSMLGITTDDEDGDPSTSDDKSSPLASSKFTRRPGSDAGSSESSTTFTGSGSGGISQRVAMTLSNRANQYVKALRKGGSEDAQIAAARCMAEMAGSQEGRLCLFAVQSEIALLSKLEGRQAVGGETSALVQEAVLDTLVKLSDAEPVHRGHLVHAGAVKALFGVIRKANAPIVKSTAARVLQNLAREGSTQNMIAEQGGTEALVELLLTGTNICKDAACGALVNLSLSPVNAVRVMKAGGLRGLLRVLAEGSDVAMEKAAAALANLALVEDNAETMLRDNAVEPLVALIRNRLQGGSMESGTHALDALCNLAVFGQSGDLVIEEGGLALLGDLLPAYGPGDTPPAEENVVPDPQPQPRKGQPPTTPPRVKINTAFLTETEIGVEIAKKALWAISNLAANPDVTEAFLAEDCAALPGIVNMLRYDIPEWQSGACIALKHLTQHPAAVDAVVAAGAIPPLITLFRTKPSTLDPGGSFVKKDASGGISPRGGGDVGSKESSAAAGDGAGDTLSDMQKAAGAVLSILSYSSEETGDAIARVGGLSLLVDLANIPVEEDDVFAEASAPVDGLTGATIMDTRAADSVEGLLEAYTGAEVGNEGSRVRAATELAEVARSVEGRAALFRHDAHALLINVLQDGRRLPQALVQVTLDIVLSMTDQDQSQRLCIVQAGLVKPLIALCAGGTLAQAVPAAQVLKQLARDEETQALIGREGGVEVLLRLLSKDATAVRQTAVAALSNLALHPDNLLRVARGGGVPHLIKMLSTSGESRETAAGCLANLALHPEIAVQLVDAGTVSPLVQLLSLSERVKESNIMSVLANLAREPGPATAICNTALKPLVDLLRSQLPWWRASAAGVLRNLSLHASLVPSIARSGAVPLAIEITRQVCLALDELGADEADGPELQACLGLLWNLSTSHDVGATMMSSGWAKSLATMIPQPDFSMAATGTVRNLACTESFAEELADRGVIKPLIDALQNENSAVQISAAGAIANLATLNKNALAIAKSGGIDALMQLLGEAEVPLQSIVGMALRNLALNESNAKYIVKQGGVAPLVEMLRGGAPPGIEAAAGALRSLALVPDHARAILDGGAAPDLIRLLSHRSPAVQESVAGVLCNMVVDLDCAIGIAQAGGMGAIINLAMKGAGTPRELASATLCNISLHDAHLIRIGDPRSVEVLVSMLVYGSKVGQESAAQAFRNLSLNMDNFPKILASGALPALLNVVQSEEARSPCAGHAAAALLQLSADPEVESQLQDMFTLLEDVVQYAPEEFAIEPGSTVGILTVGAPVISKGPATSSLPPATATAPSAAQTASSPSAPAHSAANSPSPRGSSHGSMRGLKSSSRSKLGGSSRGSGSMSAARSKKGGVTDRSPRTQASGDSADLKGDDDGAGIGPIAHNAANGSTRAGPPSPLSPVSPSGNPQPQSNGYGTPPGASYSSAHSYGTGSPEHSYGSPGSSVAGEDFGSPGHTYGKPGDSPGHTYGRPPPTGTSPSHSYGTPPPHSYGHSYGKPTDAPNHTSGGSNANANASSPGSVGHTYGNSYSPSGNPGHTYGVPPPVSSGSQWSGAPADSASQSPYSSSPLNPNPGLGRSWRNSGESDELGSPGGDAGASPTGSTRSTPRGFPEPALTNTPIRSDRSDRSDELSERSHASSLNTVKVTSQVVDMLSGVEAAMDVGTKVGALFQLAEAAKHEKDRTALFQRRAEMTILPLLTTPQSPQVQEAALSVAAHMADTDPSHRCVIADSGFIQAAISLLDSPHVEVAANAAVLLRNLARDPSSQVKISDHNGVEKLVEMLSLFAGRKRDERVPDPLSVSVCGNDVDEQRQLALEAATGAVANLASNRKTTPVIVGSGGIRLLIDLVRDGQGITKRNAAGSLSNLAVVPAQASAIVSARGIPVLVGVLRDKQAGADLAANALANIARDPMHAVAVADAGAIKPLVSLCRHGTPLAREAAAIALSSLVSVKENAELVVEADGIKPLMHLVKGTRRVGKEAGVSALRNLAKASREGEDGQWIVRKLTEEGAARLLLDITRGKHVGDCGPSLQRDAETALSYLAVYTSRSRIRSGDSGDLSSSRSRSLAASEDGSEDGSERSAHTAHSTFTARSSVSSMSRHSRRRE